MTSEHRISPYWVLFEEELAARHEWLIKLRWLAFLGSLSSIFFGKKIFNLPLPTDFLIPLVIFLGLYNGVFYLYDKNLSKRELVGKDFHRAYRNFANLQISIDLLTLGAMLHFSGGIENPFFIYFCFHIIIASILLHRLDAFLQATLAIIIINSIIIFEGIGIINHYSIFPHIFEKDIYSNTKFIFSYCFALSSALYIMIFMASSITIKLRRREMEAQQLTIKLQEQAEKLAEQTEQLIAANKNLMELDEKKSRFLRRVEHELRAPLSAVQSCLRVITDGFIQNIPDKAIELIVRAEKRTITLLGMIKELLNLSRLQDVNQPIKEELIDVAILFKDLFEYQKIKADEKKIKISGIFPNEPIFLLGDPNMFDNIFVNLVNNAIKYTPTGGEVTVELSKNLENMILKVTDTGIGIPEDHQNKIFEEFHRCPNAIEAGFTGSGLGLAITKQIIENYKGNISFKSQINKGSEFIVTLPLAKDDQINSN